MWLPLDFDPLRLEALISIESDFTVPIEFEYDNDTSWSTVCPFKPTITIKHDQLPGPTFIT